MSSALWLILLPMGALPVVYVLRRLRLGAITAILVNLLVAWLVLQLPVGVVLNLLGRAVELDELSQVTLSLLFTTTAVLFWIASSLPAVYPDGREKDDDLTKDRENRIFYPVGLATLAFFVAASLSRHLGITAIFIEGAAILTVFIIQGERLESTRAALRFLTLMSLAAPLFLLAAWRIDLYQLSGGLESTANLQQLLLFIGIGFALLLAVVPFHSWLTTTAAESSPPTATFVLTVFPVVALSTLLHLLRDFPWLLDLPQVVPVMILAGLFTAFVGGILAGVQRGFSELMGYAALYDLGCTLAILGAGGWIEITTVLAGLIIRSIALVLITASLVAIRQRTVRDGFAQLKGVAPAMPVATAGLILGGLTLAGAPVTAGFALRWQLLQLVAQADAGWLSLLVLAGLGVAVGYLRGLRAMLMPPETSKSLRTRPQQWGPLIFPRPYSLSFLIVLLGVTCVLLGLYPALLIDPLHALLGDVVLPVQ
jgi:formate hydrogenlyase subunit 3/multisubunit Na+/H+ antiporter MnhD subunit